MTEQLSGMFFRAVGLSRLGVTYYGCILNGDLDVLSTDSDLEREPSLIFCQGTIEVTDRSQASGFTGSINRSVVEDHVITSFPVRMKTQQGFRRRFGQGFALQDEVLVIPVCQPRCTGRYFQLVSFQRFLLGIRKPI